MPTLLTRCLVLACLAWPALAQATSVELQALLGDLVVLSIDGQRQQMRVGQSRGGVTLVSTNVTGAVLEIDGERRTVGLSQRVGTRYQVPEERVVTIGRNAHNQYLTTALINGRSVPVMVDTGANVVAMSWPQAQALGIDLSAGKPDRVQTASGIAQARSVVLDSVSVGGIRVDRVDATVIDSDHPATVLLGMSYLRHVRIREHNGIMSLSRVE